MKRKIKVEIDWMIPWIAGYLFTLGYTGILVNTSTWYEQLLVSFATFFTWPIFLGGAISGKIFF